MTAILIIAHAPLASALRDVAEHTFPDCGEGLMALDVPADMPPEEIAVRAGALLAHLAGSEVLVFSDVFGATPCNAAQRLAASEPEGRLMVVTGVNVPMLWRSLCYAHEPVAALAARAAAGAAQGVMQLVTSRPQNQTSVTNHAQDADHHQQ